MGRGTVIRTIDAVEHEPVLESSGASIQELLGRAEGAKTFHTRLVSIEPGGWIAKHLHDEIEHHQVVIEGELKVTLDGETYLVRAGGVLLIPAGVLHGYRNEGATPARFLSTIPAWFGYHTVYL
jgi:quercetin dioxygenase-like cupin family protein